MNTANAIGFFCLGTVMQVLPLLGIGTQDATSSLTDTSGLWLHFMGLVTGGIGGSYLLREASREAMTTTVRWAQRRAAVREQLATEQPAPQHVGVRVSF